MPTLLPIIRLVRLAVDTLWLDPSASFHLATSPKEPSVTMVEAVERGGVDGGCDGPASNAAPSASSSGDASLRASMF